MAREKFVRLSDEEHAQLKDYADNTYPDGVALGAVIGELIEEQE